jgi:hypothetical protein
MHPEFEALIDEAIQLELNVADLYLLFHHRLKEDAAFWWELAIEEENHAALLKTMRHMKDDSLEIPDKMLPDNRADLIESNREIKLAIANCSEHIDRKAAFSHAIKLENAAGEWHFNAFLKDRSESEIATVFRKLNGADLHHADRIRAYMHEHHIEG